jgi:IMP dehydrogenase
VLCCAGPQDVKDFTVVCVTDTGRLGGRLLGVVTPKEIDFLSDRHTPLAEVMFK